jgi:uncharacterized protein YjbI with pentapeptide repeats
MANQEQLKLLKKSVKAWNNWWKRQNLFVEADLSAADLSGVDLSEANLGNANLKKANLEGANLEEAIFIGAKLEKAILKKANLHEADLRAANLDATNLESAILGGAICKKANLSGADLSFADFSNARLTQTSFKNAKLSYTNFAALDLSEAIGLESVVHDGPSTVGTDTISISKGKIPEVFLRGCGLSDVDIEYAKLYNPELSNEEINRIVYKIYDLRATQAIQISPLFISYSHSDGAFVDKLETYLNKKGIRFWRDIHDATSGRFRKTN